MKIDFTKGIYTNGHPLNTPMGYYRYAQNMRSSGSAIRAEEGTEKTTVLDTLIVWGDCAMGDETILIGQKSGDAGSVIGSLDIDGNWYTIIDRGFPDTLGITEPTQIEGRRDWKGDRLVYFATASGARRINLDTYDPFMSDEDFDKTTSLFLEYDLPKATYIGENNNGEVPSGVYQVAARLVTESGASTVFGIMSEIASVVPDSLQSSRDSIDGAPPQTPTNKAIIFRIDNVDVTFKYIEIAVLTYIGLANTTQVTLMNRVTINNQTSIEITYRGASDDAQTLTVDELIASGIAYETGKYLAQKDGRLLIAAPEEAELPPINWWRVAQNITSRYVMKSVRYSEILQFDIDTDVDAAVADNVKETSSTPLDEGYNNPLTCALYKGYRRDEVYAFTLTPVFITGVYGPTVHIPAMHSVNTNPTVDGDGGATPTTANVVNLTPGSSYDWCIKAVDSLGDISDCSASTFVQLGGGPTTPTNLITLDVTAEHIVLQWDPSTAIYPKVVAKYQVFMKYQGLDTVVKEVLGNPPDATATLVGLWPLGAEYYVKAVDNLGVYSGPSNIVTASQPGATSTSVPPPVTVFATVNAPTNLIASNIETTRFTLDWTASISPNIVEYRIYRGTIYHMSVYAPAVTSTGGDLGTFISEETYPDDRYPDIPVGDGLRLHKFPTAVQQPLISGSIDNNNQYIKIIGVEFSNIGLNDQELQYADQIAGFIIGRVDRRGNETQLAQGLLRPICDVEYDSNPTYTKSILLGDGSVRWSNILNGAPNENFSSGNPDYSSMHFISPDIIHRAHTASQGTYIHQHSLYKCNPYAINNEYINKQMSGRSEPARANAFFKNIVSVSEDALNTTRKELDGTKVDVGPFGVPLMNGAAGGKINTTIVHGSDSIEMASSDGFVWIKSLDGSNIPNHLNDNSELAIQFHNNRKRGQDNNDEDWDFLGAVGDRPNFPLYTMSRDNPKQYGPLDQMISMFTHYQEWSGFNGRVEFFNGDIFINKYGLSLNDEGFYPFTNDDDQDEPYQYIGFFKPNNASAVVYMWVESINNYAYRHYIQPDSFNETSISNTNGSTPYYPEYKQLVNSKAPFGILSMHAENWVRPGYSSQYNQQYSAQPNIKPYAVTPKEDTEDLASLINRIIYSVEVVQGEKSDSYQIFLPNDYYDVPQQFGDLTDIYVNRELFACTNQVQWKLFFNTLATQVTSAGEIVLGTGGAFNRPAVPMQTVDGGFGGTSHWLHAANTVFGRAFVDQMQGRIFLLTNELEDISRTLDETTRVDIQNMNVFNILVGSEPLNERVFFRLDTKGMLSYHLIRKQFISYHNIGPRWLFSHSSYMYSNHMASAGDYQPGVHKHSVGPTGTYYGVREDSFVTLVANVEPDISKLFQNLEIISNMYTEKGNILPFNTFNQLQVWNDERNSGLNNMIFKDSAFKSEGVQEVLVSKIKDVFRLSIPRDVIIDPSIGSGTANQKQVIGGPRASWLPKMRGNFVQILLLTDNTLGPIYLLKANTLVAKNIR